MGNTDAVQGPILFEIPDFGLNSWACDKFNKVPLQYSANKG